MNGTAHTGRKVFVVLYRTGGAGSKPRKYTIGPYGRITLHQAQIAAQKVFAAKLEGRDLAAEKRDARRRAVTDRVEDLLETFCRTTAVPEPLRSRNRQAPHLADVFQESSKSAIIHASSGVIWESRLTSVLLTDHTLTDLSMRLTTSARAARRIEAQA